MELDPRVEELFLSFLGEARKGYNQAEVGQATLLLEGYLIGQFPEHLSVLKEFTRSYKEN
jgi:hypothetical protein